MWQKRQLEEAIRIAQDVISDRGGYDADKIATMIDKGVELLENAVKLIVEEE